MSNEYQATDSTAADTMASGGTYANQGEKLSTDDVVSCLIDLIETCKDGQEGFKDAAEAVKDGELKTLFFEYSQQRAQFARHLRACRRARFLEERTGYIESFAERTGRSEE